MKNTDALTINYKSDFDFILELRDGLGMPIGWPEFDWTLTLGTPTSRQRFVVFRRGGMLKGCYNDGGRIHVVADKHGLGPGRLTAEFVADLRNERYPDGVQRVVVPEPLDIVLTDRGGTLPQVLLGNISIVMPAYPAGSPSDEPSDEPDLEAIAAGCFLSVDRAGNSSRLMAHGVQPLLDAGLTPVLFRCLRRRNKNTEGARVVTHRWTRFTMLPDAVAIDADGVLSFRTDLLPLEGGTHGETAEHTTEASALCLRSDDAVVYGKPLMRLDGGGSDEPRMLRLPFMLALLDLRGEEQPARRWVPTDSPVRLPFFVRYTPMWAYNTTDLAAESRSVGHVFSFTLR